MDKCGTSAWWSIEEAQAVAHEDRAEQDRASAELEPDHRSRIAGEIMGLIVWLLVGLIAGALARLLVPGRDRLGFAGTLLLGVAGSFVGGILGNLVTHDELRISTSGFVGSVVGAVLLLLARRFVHDRG